MNTINPILINNNTYNMSFKGIFNNKPKVVPPNDVMAYDSNILLLHIGDSLPLSEDSIIVFDNRYQLDLTEKQAKKRIKNLKNGERIVYGRNDMDPQDTKISRQQFALEKKNGTLYITNLSRFGTNYRLQKPDRNRVLGDYYRMIQLAGDSEAFVNTKTSYLHSKFGAKQPNFYQLFEQKYNEIRLADYSPKSTFTTSFAEMQAAVNKPPEGGFISPESCWNFRYFQNRAYFTPSDRISLNVKADPRLIQELDNLFIYGSYVDKKGNTFNIPKEKQVTAYYKTYSDASKWTKRHDPITIYLAERPTPELLKGISDISEKYARKSCNGVPLLGALEGKPWISIDIEPNEEDFLTLFRKAKRLNPALAQAMTDYSYEVKQDGRSEFRISAAEFEAMKDITAEYEAFLRLKK